MGIYNLVMLMLHILFVHMFFVVEINIVAILPLLSFFKPRLQSFTLSSKKFNIKISVANPEFFLPRLVGSKEGYIVH